MKIDAARIKKLVLLSLKPRQGDLKIKSSWNPLSSRNCFGSLKARWMIRGIEL